MIGRFTRSSGWWRRYEVIAAATRAGWRFPWFMEFGCFLGFSDDVTAATLVLSSACRVHRSLKLRLTVCTHLFWATTRSLSPMSRKSTRLLSSWFATRLHIPLNLHPNPTIVIRATFTQAYALPSVQWWSTVYGKGLNIHERSKSSSLIDMA